MSYFLEIERAIGQFEEAAFQAASPNALARKKAMSFAARSCPDSNIAHILGVSVDWITKKPEHVHAAIYRARDALETLKFNRPDLD